MPIDGGRVRLEDHFTEMRLGTRLYVYRFVDSTGQSFECHAVGCDAGKIRSIQLAVWRKPIRS